MMREPPALGIVGNSISVLSQQEEEAMGEGQETSDESKGSSITGSTPHT